MKWPWVTHRRFEALAEEVQAFQMLERRLNLMDSGFDRVEAQVRQIDARVDAWEKAVLLAQVMQPQPPQPDVPPTEHELSDAVLKAIRQRAMPGTALYAEMVEDAAQQLAAQLSEDEVIQDQLRGARPRIWG